MKDLRAILIEKIKLLNESIWEHRVSHATIERWLENFADKSLPVSDQQIHALHLLSQFLYLGEREVRELLKAIFRDLYQYPIVAKIRRERSDTKNTRVISRAFNRELQHTRFLGMGNPSESGTHLLYYFRQENALPRTLFINGHDILSRGGRVTRLKIPSIRRYVFIDDLCGSGTQAIQYSKDILRDAKAADKTVKFSYYTLFSTEVGIAQVREQSLFDDVQAVFLLDKTFGCFSKHSRYFLPDESFRKGPSKQICSRYGKQLEPDHPLGYKNGQLLLGLFHNVPDNTLPIIWHDGAPGVSWKPIFRRYPKIY
jgi:hypothetical protein